MMPAMWRYSLLGVGGLTLLIALALFLQWPVATAVWPWPDTRLSYIFLASIGAAIAAPLLWLGWIGDAAALRGGALNLGLTNLGIAVTALVLYPLPPGTVVLGVAAMGALVLSAAIYWAVRARPLQASPPTPLPVRVSFGLFVVLLVLVGGALLLEQPVFPWPLPPPSAMIYGWIFLGAALYFLDGLLRPYWHNAKGQLLGFLAYDLVLIVPFLGHFANVLPQHRLSLTIYVAVLVYSGALAVYYLLRPPPARNRGPFTG